MKCCAIFLTPFWGLAALLGLGCFACSTPCWIAGGGKPVARQAPASSSKTILGEKVLPRCKVDECIINGKAAYDSAFNA